jgi:hypothetical protein
LDLTYFETEKQVKIKEEMILIIIIVIINIIIIQGRTDLSAYNFIARNEWILRLFNVDADCKIYNYNGFQFIGTHQD